MWVRLKSDLGRSFWVNLAQVSTIRTPAGTAGMARLMLASGYPVPLGQTAAEVVAMLRTDPAAGARWIELTGDTGRPFHANFALLRAVRPGPREFGGASLVFLPSFTVYAKQTPDEIWQVLDAQAALAAGQAEVVKARHELQAAVAGLRAAMGYVDVEENAEQSNEN